MVQVAGITYGIIGIYFFQKIVGLITNNLKAQIVASICIVFGTNLLLYMINVPFMSHVYSFTLLSIFIFLTHELFIKKKQKYLIYLAIVFALIILVRPFNTLVVLLLPIWSKSFSEFINQLKLACTNKKTLIMSAIIFILLLSTQSVVWYLQNGKLFQNSYKGNGFYFDKPHILEFLFGFASGFFIYTPLCLLVLLAGLRNLFCLNKFMLITITLFLILVIYVLSSYWAYTFYDSLGMRVMIDYYAIFGILFAYAFRTNYFRYFIYFSVPVCVFMNLVLHYQILNNIISPAYMNYDKFKYVFLKTGKEYQNILGGCNDMEPYLKNKPSVPSYTYTNADAFEYKSSAEYGVSFKLDSVKLKTNKLYIEIEVERSEKEKNSSSNALLACSIKDSSNKDKYWYAFKINETPSLTDENKRKYRYSLVIDKKMDYNDALTIFIWNFGHQDFIVNTFNVKIYDYNF